ncbi:MAG: hypothetical protein WC955_06400 [Elusimicrobiota bacterium]
MNELRNGTSKDLALGKYKGQKVEWILKADYWASGINFAAYAFLIPKRNGTIIAIPSSGMNELRWGSLCGRNLGKYAKIQGILIGTDDRIRHANIYLEVSSISFE